MRASTFLSYNFTYIIYLLLFIVFKYESLLLPPHDSQHTYTSSSFYQKGKLTDLYVIIKHFQTKGLRFA